YVGHDRRLVEEALVAVARAAGDDVAAAASRVRHEALHGIDAARVRHWPHGDALFEPVAELDAFGIVAKARNELLVGILLHVEARRRDADLAGVAVLERGDGVGCLFRVGVGEHHHRRMAAELHGGALHAFRRERREMFADWNRAGEGYLA